MRANCKAIYCPKHPKHGTGLKYDHNKYNSVLEAEVECFQPDDKEFLEAAMDRWDFSSDTIINVEYTDGFAYASDFGDNFVACVNEEYKD